MTPPKDGLVTAVQPPAIGSQPPVEVMTRCAPFTGYADRGGYLPETDKDVLELDLDPLARVPVAELYALGADIFRRIERLSHDPERRQRAQAIRLWSEWCGK